MSAKSADPSDLTSNVPVNPSDPRVLDPKSRIGPVLEKDHSDEIETQAYTLWSSVAAGWLTILSVPLVAFPRVATLLLGTLLEESRDPLTRRHHQGAEQAATNVVRKWNPLERTLGGFAGMLGLTLAGILVIQTGALPLTTDAISSTSARAPHRKPTIWISVAFFGLLAYHAGYSLSLFSIAIPSAALSAWGFYVVFFAHRGRVNEVSSGASSFPFKNAVAEDKKAEHKKQ